MKEEAEEEEGVIDDDDEGEEETKVDDATAKSEPYAKKLKLRITTWLVSIARPDATIMLTMPY